MKTMVLMVAILAGGCYHYRAAMGREATPATEPQTLTAWSFAWGLVQTNVDPPDCQSHALHEVTVTTNYAYAALTVLSLGLVAPAQVEWRCATDRPCPACDL